MTLINYKELMKSHNMLFTYKNIDIMPPEFSDENKLDVSIQNIENNYLNSQYEFTHLKKQKINLKRTVYSAVYKDKIVLS